MHVDNILIHPSFSYTCIHIHHGHACAQPYTYIFPPRIHMHKYHTRTYMRIRHAHTHTHTIHTDVHTPFTYSVHTYNIMKSNRFSYRNEGAHNTYVALIYTLPSHVSYTRWYLFINICIQKCSWVGSPG